MPLINCPECDKQVSDLALACPHCGAPRVETKLSTQTTLTKGPPSPGNVLSSLIALVGLILLFIVPPVGLTMLIAAGFFGLFTSKKRPLVFVGRCPSCNGLINLPQHLGGAPCPLCKTPVVSRDGRFFKG